MRTGKAYISFDREFVKILIPSKENEFLTLPKNEIINFLKNKNIRKILVTGFFPDLLSIKIPLPFSDKRLKNKRIIEGFLKTELLKKYNDLKKIFLNYEVVKQEARAWIRVYLIGEKESEFINNLIINGFELIGNYPFFTIIRESLSVQKFDKDCQLVCLFSKKIRYLFLFQQNEMVFQRSYETESEFLSEDDVININMTISYSIQNLRIHPKKVIFIGVKKEEFQGINIVYEFLNIYNENLSEYLILNLLREYEDKIRGKEFLPQDYKNFKKLKNYMSYVTYLILPLLLLSILYMGNLSTEILRKLKDINIYKREIFHKEIKFFTLKKALEDYERNSKPLVDLFNKKSSYPDIRFSLNSIAKAKALKKIEINSIEIEIAEPQKVKISGVILADTFLERQKAYENFKKKIQREGFKIFQEKWDLIKGEYILEANYGVKRIS